MKHLPCYLVKNDQKHEYFTRHPQKMVGTFKLVVCGLVTMICLASSQTFLEREESKKKAEVEKAENREKSLLPETPIYGDGTEIEGVDTHDWDTAFCDVKLWDRLPKGKWLVESKTDSVTKYVNVNIDSFAGQKVSIVRIRTKTGTELEVDAIESIEVIWSEMTLSAGSTDNEAYKENARRITYKQEKAIKEINEKNADKLANYYRLLKESKKDIRQVLVDKFGKPKEEDFGTTPLFKSQVDDFDTKKGVKIRFFKAEPSLLMAIITRIPEKSGDKPEAKPNRRDKSKFYEITASNRNTFAAANVEKTGWGDVEIKNIPMHVQGIRGYCSAGTIAMVAEYWGATLPIDLLGEKIYNTEIAGNRAGHALTIQAIAAELNLNKPINECQTRAGVKNLIENLKKEIDQGRPIFVARRFSQARQMLHEDWKKQVEKDPDFKIFDPKLPGEQSQWATKDFVPHASVVTGYNARRKEILLTESWGETARNQRMSYDEFLATVIDCRMLVPKEGPEKPAPNTSEKIGTSPTIKRAPEIKRSEIQRVPKIKRTAQPIEKSHQF